MGMFVSEDVGNGLTATMRWMGWWEEQWSSFYEGKQEGNWQGVGVGETETG